MEDIYLQNYLDKLNQLDQLRGFKRVRLTVASSKVIVHDVKNGDFIEESVFYCFQHS